MSVSPAASLVFVGNYLGRSRPRVQIAKATIAGDYVREAFFYRAVMAVPVHRSSPDINHRAPRGITPRSTRRACQARCHNGGHSNYQSREFGRDHRKSFTQSASVGRAAIARVGGERQAVTHIKAINCPPSINPCRTRGSEERSTVKGCDHQSGRAPDAESGCRSAHSFREQKPRPNTA